MSVPTLSTTGLKTSPFHLSFSSPSPEDPLPNGFFPKNITVDESNLEIEYLQGGGEINPESSASLDISNLDAALNSSVVLIMNDLILFVEFDKAEICCTPNSNITELSGGIDYNYRCDSKRATKVRKTV